MLHLFQFKNITFCLQIFVFTIIIIIIIIFAVANFEVCLKE